MSSRLYAYSLSQGNLAVLTRIQNKALRFVYDFKRFGHISQYRLFAGVLMVTDSCDLQKVKLIHKTLLTGKPDYLRHNLVFGHQVCERNTRQDDLYLVSSMYSCFKAFIVSKS